MQQPDEGYVPAGGVAPVSPFAGFDNLIRYHDMVDRNQVISQYQNEYVAPMAVTAKQRRAMMSNPMFSYGTSQDDMNGRFAARQNDINVKSAAGGVAYGVSVATAYAAAAAPSKLISAAMFGTKGLLAGTAGSFVLPMMIAQYPIEQISKGIQRSVERQRYMHQVAADMEQYRSMLGFRDKLSYKQASAAGEMIFDSATKPGQFFNIEQQMRMHQIAISNDMLSARGGGAGNSGTIAQYKKNFDELKKTTEEVVKLLQTTMEGGMSVIKELNQSGFTSLRDIKNQVRSAKAMGAMTGLGSQNMMQIGLAGAMAVQGTPISAAQGARMYQGGALYAHQMTQIAGEGSFLVGRAGGVAAAGQQIAAAQMNAAMSGMGTRMFAAVMNADGTINDKKMGALLSGQMSAYDVTVGANQNGLLMGNNRVMFDVNRRRALNQMTPEALNQFFTRQFDLWRSTRGGNIEQQAHVFAGLNAQDPLQQELLRERLLTIDPSTKADILGNAIDESMKGGAPRRSALYKLSRDLHTGLTFPFRASGEMLANVFYDSMRGTANFFQQSARDAAYKINDFLGDPYSYVANANVGNYSRAKLESLGGGVLTQGELESLGNTESSKRVREGIAKIKAAREGKDIFSLGVVDLFPEDLSADEVGRYMSAAKRSTISQADLRYLDESLFTANYNGTEDVLLKNKGVNRLLADTELSGIPAGRAHRIMVEASKRASEQYTQANSSYEKFVKDNGLDIKEVNALYQQYAPDIAQTLSYGYGRGDGGEIQKGDYSDDVSQALQLKHKVVLADLDVKRLTVDDAGGNPNVDIEGYIKKQRMTVEAAAKKINPEYNFWGKWFNRNAAKKALGVDSLDNDVVAKKIIDLSNSDELAATQALRSYAGHIGIGSVKELIEHAQQYMKESEDLTTGHAIKKAEAQIDAYIKKKGLSAANKDVVAARSALLGSGEFDDSAISGTASMTGASIDVIKNIIKRSGADGLRINVLNTEASGFARESRDEDLQKESNRLLEEMKEILARTENGELEGKDKADYEKLEEKQKKIEHVLTQKSSTDAGDRTKTLSASAVPPVLNYWNNNWRY